jgi:hypothetical protein
VVRAAGNALTVTTGPAGPADFVLALRRIAPERLTLVRTAGQPVHDAQQRYLGESLEREGQELFAARRGERVDQFVAAHPDLVNNEA